MTSPSFAADAPAARVPQAGLRVLARVPAFWRLQIAGWMVVSLLALPVRHLVLPDEIANATFLSFCRAFGGIVISAFLLRPFCVRWIENPPAVSRLVGLAGLAVLCAATLETALAAAINFSFEIGERTAGHLFAVFVMRLTLYAFWCALFLGVRTLQRERERGIRLAMAEERARLETLRCQLNPHFLFNSLTTLRGLIRATPDAAIDVVSRLAAFYREALRRVDGREAILLGDEVELLRAYLEIERARLGSRLQVEFAIAPGLERHIIPPALLLPLVENAVKYGAVASPEIIRVSFLLEARTTDTLEIEVANTGRWLRSPAAPEPTSTGVGLANLRSRLALFYPGRHDLKFLVEAGWVRARLSLHGQPRLAALGAQT